MIKFFRKIRQKLIDQNKMGKYFTYAVGEIVLVVIGILIALQINNWNTNRAKEIEAYNQLVEVQKEIVNNSIAFDELGDFYFEKLKNVRRVFYDTLDIEDYRNNPDLSSILALIDPIETQNEAFTKLIQNADNLPDQYKVLVQDLKILYNLSSLEEMYKAFMSDTNKYFESINEFATPMYFGKLDDYYQFLLTSKDYKNMIALASANIDDLAPELVKKKYSGITLYKKMLDLGFPDTDLQKIKSIYLDVTDTLAKSFTGKYTNSKDTLAITFRDNKLIGTYTTFNYKDDIKIRDSLTLYFYSAYLEFNKDKSEFYDILDAKLPHYKKITTND